MYFSMCDFQVHKNIDRDYENNINTIRDSKCICSFHIYYSIQKEFYS